MIRTLLTNPILINPQIDFLLWLQGIREATGGIFDNFFLTLTSFGETLIVFTVISLIYWFAKNKPQFILGVLLTLTSTILLIYEFIFYFSKVENFLSKKGIEFDDKDKPTFDFDILEKNPAVNNTPLSKNNPGPYTADEKSSGDKEVRDVEVTDSYEVDKDKKDKEGEKHDGGFGF